MSQFNFSFLILLDSEEKISKENRWKVGFSLPVAASWPILQIFAQDVYDINISILTNIKETTLFEQSLIF